MVQLIILNALVFALHPLVPERAVGRVVVIWVLVILIFFFKFETRSHYAALAGLKLTVICLPLSTGCCDEKAFATKPSDTGVLLERCLG